MIGNKKGFTIFEILVVMAILAIMVLVATPDFRGTLSESRELSVKNDAYTVSKMAKVFRLENGFFPVGNLVNVAELKTFADNGKVYNTDGTVLAEDITASAIYEIDWDLLSEEVFIEIKTGEYLLTDSGDAYYLNGSIDSIESAVCSSSSYTSYSQSTTKKYDDFRERNPRFIDDVLYVSGDYIYGKKADGTVAIVEYTVANNVAVVVPGKINGQEVSEISFGGANGNIGAYEGKGAASVDIPCTVKKISKNAFYDNNLSGTLTIPDSVVEIGENAFSGMDTSLITSENNLTSVVLGNGLKTIGNYAFADNSISSVTFGGALQYIGTGAFKGNSIGGNLALPSSLVNIGAMAFTGEGGTNNITGVTLGNSLTDIGDRAFSSNAIGSLSFGSSLKNIGNEAFLNNNISGSISIPNTVVSIGDKAFAQIDSIDNTPLTSNRIGTVSFGNQLQKIGDYAFYDNNITSIVTLPNSLLSVGVYSFAENGIGTLNIGTSVAVIGANSFLNNSITGQVEIPQNVKIVGAKAFQNNGIQTLVLSHGLEIIDDYAFDDNAISGTLLFPTTVASINEYAFRNNEFTEITLPSSVKRVGLNAFYLNSLIGVNIDNSEGNVNIGLNAFTDKLGNAIAINYYK